jgi:hypothetical protein
VETEFSFKFTHLQLSQTQVSYVWIDVYQCSYFTGTGKELSPDMSEVILNSVKKKKQCNGVRTSAVQEIMLQNYLLLYELWIQLWGGGHTLVREAILYQITLGFIGMAAVMLS